MSVIIPALDVESTIGLQLEALAAQQPSSSFEIIVADNGSRDRTADVAASHVDRLPLLRVIDASAVRGSSHARNEGAAAAEGDLLCFCDADDVVDPGWLAALVQAAGRADLVGGALELDRLNDAATRSWRPTPRATAVAADRVGFVPSGNCAIWRDAFDRLGGFDEAYLKAHDVELSARARAAGMTLAHASGAIVHYRLRSTMRGVARQAYRAGFVSVQLAVDHPRPHRPVPGVPWREAGWLALRLPTLASRSRRGIWVRRAGEAAGRTVALVRLRPRR